MADYVRHFLYASLTYLMLGSTLGALLGIPPVQSVLYAQSMGLVTRAHAHLQLVGFVSMMIFGIAYHALPRFSGRSLWSISLARWHFVLGQTGLVGMVLAFSFAGLRGWLPVFGLVLWVSMLLFVLNIVQTIRPAPARKVGLVKVGPQV